MGLPSLDQLLRRIVSTVRRFPVVLAMAVVTTVAAIALVAGPVDATWERLLADATWERLLAAASLGLPLTFAFTLLAERRNWTGSGRAALHALALAVLAAVFLAWPTWTDAEAFHRYVQLSAGFHLLAAFLPFVGVRERNGFWQYNRALFLRFLTAALYSVALYAGLAIALAALDNLFGVPVSSETYVRLWYVIAILFQTWFFLGGVPDDLPALEHRTDYPRGLEIFVQYVLVPLVAIYLLILTAYAVKVTVTWEWPSGSIGWLVSRAAMAGILAALLVHPVRDEADNRWIRIYGRWFYVALLPSIAVLLLAIRQRIGQYGVTEQRYFLLVLALWLAGIALYYAATRSDDIELVPRSLCAVALLTFLGPWSAYEISERSQRNRLEGLLTRHELVVEERVDPADAPREVPFEDRREISATVRYLMEAHGAGAVEPVFGGELPVPVGEEVAASADSAAARETSSGSGRPPSEAERLVRALGIEYVSRGEREETATRITLRAVPYSASRPIGRYDRVVRNVSSRGTDSLVLGEAGLVLRADGEGLRILRDGRTALELSVSDAAGPLLERHREPPTTDADVPADEMWITGRTEQLRAALWLRSIHVSVQPGEPMSGLSWTGELFLGT